jgi:hypothetical protein
MTPVTFAVKTKTGQGLCVSGPGLAWRLPSFFSNTLMAQVVLYSSSWHPGYLSELLYCSQGKLGESCTELRVGTRLEKVIEHHAFVSQRLTGHWLSGHSHDAKAVEQNTTATRLVKTSMAGSFFSMMCVLVCL